MAALQILLRARRHVADVDRLAGFWIGVEAILRRRVLQVEYGGEPLGGAGESGVRGDVAHPLVTDPALPVVPQPGKQLGSGSCGHGPAPLRAPAAPCRNPHGSDKTPACQAGADGSASQVARVHAGLVSTPVCLGEPDGAGAHRGATLGGGLYALRRDVALDDLAALVALDGCLVGGRD